MDFYDASYSNIVMRWGNKFLETLDVSNNLVKITKALKGIPNGMIALIMAFGAFLALLGFGSLAYYFDLDSTWTAMAPLQQKVINALQGVAAAAFIGWTIRFVPTALTVLPTVSEMLGARFARFNIPAFQAVTWLFVLWDLGTDIPRVNENINPLWPQFVQGSEATGILGILATFDLRVIGGAIGFYVVWVLALLGASYFLELITVMLLWAFVALLWKSIGYWAAKFMAGKKGGFSGDLGGSFDRDFQGDEFHSQEAYDFGGSASSSSRRSRRAAPRRSARPAGAAFGGGFDGGFGDDDLGWEDFGDGGGGDFGDVFGGGLDDDFGEFADFVPPPSGGRGGRRRR